MIENTGQQIEFVYNDDGDPSVGIFGATERVVVQFPDRKIPLDEEEIEFLRLGLEEALAADGGYVVTKARWDEEREAERKFMEDAAKLDARVDSEWLKQVEADEEASASLYIG